MLGTRMAEHRIAAAGQKPLRRRSKRCAEEEAEQERTEIPRETPAKEENLPPIISSSLV